MKGDVQPRARGKIRAVNRGVKKKRVFRRRGHNHIKREVPQSRGHSNTWVKAT